MPIGLESLIWWVRICLCLARVCLDNCFGQVINIILIKRTAYQVSFVQVLLHLLFNFVYMNLKEKKEYNSMVIVTFQSRWLYDELK